MSKLLINEPPLQVLPSLAKAIGLNEAIFVQQLHYWLQTSAHNHDGRRWIYNTYAGWLEQFPFWSESTVRRIVTTLRDRGLLITTDQYNRKTFDNTLWYSIDYDRLAALELPSVHFEQTQPSAQLEQTICSEWTDDLSNLNRPIPETTTKTTTEKGEGDRGAALAPATQVSPQQELFGAVCEAVGWDYRTLTKEDQGQVAQTCGILGKAGYVAGDVATFMQAVWFKDWRWQKNQALPTIKQLRQEIGKIRSAVPAAAPASVGKNLQGVADYINRQRSAS